MCGSSPLASFVPPQYPSSSLIPSIPNFMFSSHSQLTPSTRVPAPAPAVALPRNPWPRCRPRPNPNPGPSPIPPFILLLETGFHRVGQPGLDILTSSNPLISRSAGITGVSHWVLPTGFSVGQAGLELPILGYPPTLASQSAGITRLALLPRLEYSGTILVTCILAHLHSRNPPILASSVAEMIGWSRTPEFKPYPPTYQSDRITGMSHCAPPRSNCLLTKILVLERVNSKRELLDGKDIHVGSTDMRCLAHYEVLLCHPGCSIVAQSWLPAAPLTWAQATLPSQPP
ncbi:hypothetical protein AAY473_036914, partial [Plecturocebus cupreus]